MTKDVTTSLRELVEKARATAPLPWDEDTEPGDPSGPNYHTAAIYDANGRKLFDSINTDSGLVEVEHDEIGAYAWDEYARRRARLIVAAVNALPGLLDEIEGLRADRDALLSSEREQHVSNVEASYRAAEADLLARALSAEGEVERLKAAQAQAIADLEEEGLFIAAEIVSEAARLSIGKGNGEGIPGPVTNADAACSLRETLVPGECQTCDGQGIVGTLQHNAAAPGFEVEPCPDCTNERVQR